MKSGSGKDLASKLNDTELSECYEKIKITYEDRLKSILTGIKTELESFSWFCSKIYELADGLYAIGVSRDPSHLTRDGDPDERDVEVTVQVSESADWDENVRGGVSFSIDAHSANGEYIGYITPLDITQDTWVPAIDAESIEARMVTIEMGHNPFDMIKLLRKWLKGKAPR